MEFGFQVCGDAFRFPHETAVLLVKGVGGTCCVVAWVLLWWPGASFDRITRACVIKTRGGLSFSLQSECVQDLDGDDR